MNPELTQDELKLLLRLLSLHRARLGTPSLKPRQSVQVWARRAKEIRAVKALEDKLKEAQKEVLNDRD